MSKNFYTLLSKVVYLYAKDSKEHSTYNKEFEDFTKKIKNHPALNHELFDYLKEESKTGFNSQQFALYRDNFFSRTRYTIPSVAYAIIAAGLAEDHYSISQSVKNLYDEGGAGNVEKIHSKLLLNSHNIHGEKIFGLQPLTKLRDSLQSSLILQSTKDYVASKEALLMEKRYGYVIGNSWAHELAADGMLENFRESFFEPYSGYYKPEEYEKVMEFYKAHRDDEVENGDVELEHERIAKRIIENYLSESPDKIDEIKEGALTFLDRQAALWTEMMQRLDQIKDKKTSIMPQPLVPSIEIKIQEIKKITELQEKIGLC